MVKCQFQLYAIILAAGYGTRLKDKGKKTPKGLFKNKQDLSITDMAISQLMRYEAISKIALITNQRFFKQYRNHLTAKYPELNIKIINDGSTQPENRLGSLGDLFFALEELGWWDKNLLVLPSDRTPENIISHLILLFKKTPNSFITCVAQEPKEKIKNKSGCAVLNKQQQIIDFEEKPLSPKSNLRAIPFYIFPQTSLALLKKYRDKGQNMDSPGNIIPWLLKNKFPVQAHVTHKNSFDIGDLQELASFQTQYQLKS
jgi:glucose-1-phosphate thymidylyltransferase